MYRKMLEKLFNVCVNLRMCVWLVNEWCALIKKCTEWTSLKQPSISVAVLLHYALHVLKFLVKNQGLF